MNARKVVAMSLFDFFKKKEVSKAKSDGSDLLNKIQDNAFPIEKGISGKMPTCDSLYPHEILVLSYASYYCTSGNKFPKFWSYEYGIKDVQSILSKLEKDGFIEIDSSANRLTKKKISELKPVLQSHGLKASGKKSEMIERILENISEEELDILFPDKPYKYTQKGEALLKKFEWIPYIHNHRINGLDIRNFTEKMQTPPYRNYRDKIWQYFNEECIKNIETRDFGCYRCVKLEMADFLVEEHNEKGAFKLLCEVISYDLSGLCNGFNMEYLSIYSENFFPYEKSIVTMAPAITKRIKNMSDDFGWSEKELISNLLKEISAIKLPFTIFIPEEKVEIVIAEINDDKSTLESIYNTGAKRFKRQYRI